MKELSQEDLADIATLVDMQKSLGLVSLAKEFYSGELDLVQDKYFKLNLPNSVAEFISGNGEGIWVYPLTDADKTIYDNDIKGETFDCIVMNDCITYPIQCGSIIKGRITGSDTRPTIDFDWFDNTIKTVSNDEMSLKDLLED
jgi:hypothetical protein